ncbi:hypothetical protein [Sphingomonas sp. MMS24-J13]|uniref:hypothetical protein n=1 Tax=Sphingomonas sp. MMS24-J13 TaxID=3238686 RepID=UPI00384EE569
MATFSAPPPIEITLENGIVIEVSVGEGSAVLQALQGQSDALVQEIEDRQAAVSDASDALKGGADSANDTLKKVGDRVTASNAALLPFAIPVVPPYDRIKGLSIAGGDPNDAYYVSTFLRDNNGTGGAGRFRIAWARQSDSLVVVDTGLLPTAGLNGIKPISIPAVNGSGMTMLAPIDFGTGSELWSVLSGSVAASKVDNSRTMIDLPMWKGAVNALVTPAIAAATATIAAELSPFAVTVAAPWDLIQEVEILGETPTIITTSVPSCATISERARPVGSMLMSGGNPTMPSSLIRTSCRRRR